MHIKDFPIGYSIAPLQGNIREENLEEQRVISKHLRYCPCEDLAVKLEALKMGFTVVFAELLRREAQGTLTEADAEILRIRRGMDKRLCQEHPVERMVTAMQQEEHAQFDAPLVVCRR